MDKGKHSPAPGNKGIPQNTNDNYREAECYSESNVSSSSSGPTPKPLSQLRNSLNTILNMMDSNTQVGQIFQSDEDTSVLLDISDNLGNRIISSTTNSLSDEYTKSEDISKGIATKTMQEGKLPESYKREAKNVKAQSSMEEESGNVKQLSGYSCEVESNGACQASTRACLGSNAPGTTTFTNTLSVDTPHVISSETCSCRAAASGDASENTREVSRPLPVVKDPIYRNHQNTVISRQRGGGDIPTLRSECTYDHMLPPCKVSPQPAPECKCTYNQKLPPCTCGKSRGKRLARSPSSQTPECECAYDHNLPPCMCGKNSGEKLAKSCFLQPECKCTYDQKVPPCTCGQNSGERYHKVHICPMEVPNESSDTSHVNSEEAPCSCPKPTMKSRFLNAFNFVKHPRSPDNYKHPDGYEIPTRLVFDLVDGIPGGEEYPSVREAKEKKFLPRGKQRQATRIEESCLADPNRVDVYYFDHGNSGYYRTTDRPPHLVTELLMEQTEYCSTKFWAEIFGTLHIAFAFVTSFVLQLFRFLLYSILRPLTVGVIQLASDYFFKPLLTILFNGVIQPCLILLYNTATSFRDLCAPVAETVGFFLREMAVLVGSARLVEVNSATYVHQHQPKQSSKCRPV